MRGERGTSKPYLRGEIWWIRYMVPGEGGERRESSRSTKKADALRLLHDRLKRIDDRVLVPGRPTVGQLLQLYLADQRREQRHSYRASEGYVRLHLDPAFGRCFVDSFTSAMLKKFVEDKQKEGYAAAGINQFLAALKRAFRLGMEENPPLAHVVPAIRMLPVSNARKGFLDHAGYLQMREALPPHQQTLLVLGYHLGMRLGELLALRWDQVDWVGGVIGLEADQTKGNQARIAPLYGELRAWLDMAYSRRIAERERAARGGGSMPIGSETLVSIDGHSIRETKTAWRKARVKVGLPGLLIHDLRRTAVRNMVRAGIPEKQAMLISGHRTRSVFERYNIIDARDVQVAGEKMAAYMEAERLRAETHAFNKVRTTIRTIDSGEGDEDSPETLTIQ